MNASTCTLPEISLATWSRTTRPRLMLAAASSRQAAPDDRAVDPDENEWLDDVLFGCSAAVLMALPVILASMALAG